MSSVQFAAARANPAAGIFSTVLEKRRCLFNAKSVPTAMHSDLVQRGRGPLASLMRSNGLYCVFQPIVSLRDGSIYSHEALIRGRPDSALHAPDRLLDAAAKEGLSEEFENHCLMVELGQWSALHESRRLFVNISAKVLEQVYERCGRELLLAYIRDLGILPSMLVLEITEHERVSDMDYLAEIVQDIRETGVSLALDDFGDGRSSLRLWSQLKPEIVKIDKYFTKDISKHAEKVKTIQALQQIAEIFDTTLVAEGIETEDDLRVLRDLGIAYGQGYFLGRPALLPRESVEPQALMVIQDRRVAVYPELRRVSHVGQKQRVSVVEAPCATLHTTNDELASILLARTDLHAIAVVDGSRPVGIINRTDFMNAYSKSYYRELWGRKPCASHINPEPRVIERNHPVEELLSILTSTDQRYLIDGFIVTENGRYVGLGTGDQLVRSVMETRIEAARHANPLTFLPGNIPISQHIERLLASGAEFIACYADLNNFKPFNDQYGYWRGDEMIRLVAKLALAHCNPQRDFVGHVGGDDFVILYQSTDWQLQCEQIISEFAQQAIELFDAPAREAGGIHAEDRHGVARFFPLTTLSIGAVNIHRDEYTSAEQVASVAARAKHDAKIHGEGLVVRDNTNFNEGGVF
ncbi:Phytochrome-like protein cph2 [Polaromonas vacuolata]|uniref:Phytochrome-like protein cph2 n=1 Tax=Polaromonas vacuolata TaxID=37448 RepID=A0A6H2H5S4_9BURK|nr:phosphodiesterase [Polaromonas vacuolata]QJC55200.1 Phytochrome-like protein cph2 [Polaromonas vacuolata]